MSTMNEMSKKIWEKVKANRALLESCDYHDFSIDVTEERTIDKTWKCSNYGGTVTSTTKHWYEQGLEHGHRIAKGD